MNDVVITVHATEREDPRSSQGRSAHPGRFIDLVNALNDHANNDRTVDRITKHRLKRAGNPLADQITSEH